MRRGTVDKKEDVVEDTATDQAADSMTTVLVDDGGEEEAGIAVAHQWNDEEWYCSAAANCEPRVSESSLRPPSICVSKRPSRSKEPVWVSHHWLAVQLLV